MDQALEMRAGVLDANGTVVDDVPCRKCGYNLRGLFMTGRCPECGLAVGRSLTDDLLRFADPTWVTTLGRGAGRILWGILLMVVVGIASMAAMIATAAAPAPAPLVLAASMAASLLAYALTWWGMWMLTAPDPSGLGEEQYGRVRRFVRFSVVAGLVAHLLTMGGTELSGLPSAFATLIFVATAVGGLLGWIGWLMLFRYVQKLVRRVPDQKLAGRAGFIWKSMIGLGIYFVLVFAVVMASLFSVVGFGAFTAATTPPPTGTVTTATGGPTAFDGETQADTADYLAVTAVPSEDADTETDPTSAAPLPPWAGPAGTAPTLPAGAAGGAAAGAVAIGACAVSLGYLFALILFLLAVRVLHKTGKLLLAQADVARATWAGE